MALAEAVSTLAWWLPNRATWLWASRCEAALRPRSASSPLLQGVVFAHCARLRWPATQPCLAPIRRMEVLQSFTVSTPTGRFLSDDKSRRRAATCLQSSCALPGMVRTCARQMRWDVDCGVRLRMAFSKADRHSSTDHPNVPIVNRRARLLVHRHWNAWRAELPQCGALNSSENEEGLRQSWRDSRHMWRDFFTGTGPHSVRNGRRAQTFFAAAVLMPRRGSSRAHRERARCPRFLVH